MVQATGAHQPASIQSSDNFIQREKPQTEQSENPNLHNPTPPPTSQTGHRACMRQSLGFASGLTLGSIGVACAIPSFRAFFQETLPTVFKDTIRPFFTETTAHFFESVGENVTDASQAMIDSSIANNIAIGACAVIGAPMVVSKYLHKQLRNWTDVNRNRAVVNDLRSAAQTDGKISPRTANRLIKASHQLKVNHDFRDYKIEIAQGDNTRIFNSSPYQQEKKTTIRVILTHNSEIASITLQTPLPNDEVRTIPCYQQNVQSPENNRGQNLVLEESGIKIPTSLKDQLKNCGETIAEPLAQNIVKAIRPANHQLKGHFLLGPRVTDHQSLDPRSTPSIGKRLLNTCQVVLDTTMAPITLPLLLTHTAGKAIRHALSKTSNKIQLDSQQVSDAMHLMQAYSSERKTKGHTNIIEASALGASITLGISASTLGLAAPIAIAIGGVAGTAAYGSGRFFLPSRFNNHENLLRDSIEKLVTKSALNQLLQDNNYSDLNLNLDQTLNTINQIMRSLPKNKMSNSELGSLEKKQERLAQLAQEINSSEKEQAVENISKFVELTGEINQELTQATQKYLKNYGHLTDQVENNIEQASEASSIPHDRPQPEPAQMYNDSSLMEEEKEALPTWQEIESSNTSSLPAVIASAPRLSPIKYPVNSSVNSSVDSHSDPLITAETPNRHSQIKNKIARLYDYKNFEKIVNSNSSKKENLLKELENKLLTIKNLILDDHTLSLNEQITQSERVDSVLKALNDYRSAQPDQAHEAKQALLKLYNAHCNVLNAKLKSYRIPANEIDLSKA